MTRLGPEQPWSVPVAIHEVPDSGRRVELAADERSRAAVAKAAGLRSLPRLEATFDLTPRGRGGLRVVGGVSATVGQDCVVTLEPIENEVEEEIDLAFAPVAAPAAAEDDGEAAPVEVTVEDTPEALVGGIVDLGAIATEFLMLGVDPYPRKPGVAFEPPPAGEDQAHPFAALAALKKGDRDRGG